MLLFAHDPNGVLEKQQIRSRYLSEDSINTQSTTDSRSRTVSRKEITDNGNLSIVYENNMNGGIQSKDGGKSQQADSQKNDHNTTSKTNNNNNGIDAADNRGQDNVAMDNSEDNGSLVTNNDFKDVNTATISATRPQFGCSMKL